MPQVVATAPTTRPSAADVETMESAAAVAREAQRAVNHLQQLTREQRAAVINGPTEFHEVLGVGAEISATMEQTLSQLTDWIEKQLELNFLVAEEGPFVDEPEAAVAVTSQALGEAREACAAMQQALDRAHLATEQLSRPPRDRAFLARRRAHKGAVARKLPALLLHPRRGR